MPQWIGVITNAGGNLLNEWVNEKSLHFESAATGTGIVDAVAMLAQTDLVKKKQSASIVNAEEVDGGVRLKLRITAAETGYTLNQYGIWASVDDANAVMIALFQHDHGIPIPSVEESPDFIYTFYAMISISNRGEWTVNVDTSAVVNRSDMDEAITAALDTLPTWAKQETKPTYTATEVGARPKEWVPTIEDIGTAGKSTKEGGEIFNDYENNEALAPYSKADGYSCRAGIHGYKLLAVAKSGENYNITVGDADLESKARDNYATGELLCFDGQGHFYDCLKITAISTNADGNSVIKVTPTDDRDLTKLVVDESTDEWENWVYVLEKPDAGVPVLAARGAYAGGVGSVAVGYGAFAHGRDNTSVGSYAHTAGRGNVAYYAGYAKGRKNKALGEDSSAEGSGNTVTGASAHAAGMNNIVSGKGAHAHNSSNTASGVFSSASGLGTTASGEMADAGGKGTTAKGQSAFSRGTNTQANATNAAAFGSTTKASGTNSVAFGNGTEAIGSASVAMGYGTVAKGHRQLVHGDFNIPDNTKAHIVGRGTDANNRKNIYTLDWDGNAEFAGKVYSGGKELAPLEAIPVVPDWARADSKPSYTASEVGAASVGLVHESYISPNGTDDEVMGFINDQYSKMQNDTTRFVVIGCSKAHPVIAGASYLCKIYRHTDKYGNIELDTYVDQRFKRSFHNGVWAAWENHSHSAFAPSGFGLGTVNPPVVSDLNTCLGNGWYYTNAQTLNVPGSYFRYATVHVTARTSQQIAQRLVAVEHYAKPEVLRYTADGGKTWVEEWVNPPMVLNVSYRTTKRSNSKPVYTKLVSFGALPVGNGVNNAGVKQVSCGVEANKIISLTGYAYKDDEFNPLPMGVAGTLGAYCYVTGSAIGVTAMKDLSSYTAGFVIEFIK